MIHLNITFPANVATALPLKLSFAIERRTSNSPDAHYALHGGPEPARHFADVHVNKHDEVDTYEAAFCKLLSVHSSGFISKRAQARSFT